MQERKIIYERKKKEKERKDIYVKERKKDYFKERKIL